MQRAIRATIPVAALFFVGLATLAAPTTRAAAAGTVRRPPPAAQPPPANPAWTASRAPLPSGGHRAALFTVVCPAATSCVAAGNFWDSGGLEHGLLETRQGSTWTPSAAPRPAGSGSGLPLSLDGVACPSATACVAAGGYQDSAGTGHGLLVTGHASAWAAGRTPVPGNAATAPGAAYSALSEVACASAAS